MKMPLFPLDLYLLPDGIGQLRVFEPRYLRLVKLAMEGDQPQGFGLCMKIDNDFCRFGTRVKIIDFDRLENGMLTVTIQGVEKFLLSRCWEEEDELNFGEIESLPNWPTIPLGIDHQDKAISDSLAAIFNEYPEYAHHYPTPNFDDMTWVCQRWLEILPLETNQKQWFMSRLDPKDALNFLHDVIEQALNNP